LLQSDMVSKKARITGYRTHQVLANGREKKEKREGKGKKRKLIERKN